MPNRATHDTEPQTQKKLVLVVGGGWCMVVGWVVLVVVVGGVGVRRPGRPRRPSHTHTPLSGLHLGRARGLKKEKDKGGVPPTYLIFAKS